MNEPIYHLPRDLAYDIFRNFTERSTQAIFIVDLQSIKILYINPAAQELWEDQNQSDPAELQHLIRMIHKEDRDHVLEKIKGYMSGHGPNNFEFRINSKDPDQWICLTLNSIEDEKGEKLQLMAIAENITRRKEYELYLFRHNAKKNSILAILSHDLRNPLSNIALISGLLKEQHEKKESLKGSSNLIDMIERTCTQALDLINQYVDTELLELSTIEVKKTRVEIVGRVNSIIETLKATDDQMDRSFWLEAIPRDKIWVEIDEVKLLQVINNLISNAIKFTHAGGNINIILEDTKNSLLLTVKDDGIGIPEELQPYLFDEFTKARRKGLKGEETVGLGLSIN